MVISVGIANRLLVYNVNQVGSIANVTTFSPPDMTQYSGVFLNSSIISNTVQQIFNLYGAIEGNFLFQYGNMEANTCYQMINSLQGQHVHIRNMLLGSAQPLVGATWVAAVNVQGTMHAGTIDDLEITNSQLNAHSMPAVRLSTFASATFTNSIFNLGSELAVPLYVFPGFINAVLNINNVTFANNYETPLVIDSRFETNDAFSLMVYVTNSNFRNNVGSFGGAIASGSHHTTIQISGSNFVNNQVVATFDNFMGTISCSDNKATPNIALVAPLNTFSGSRPKDFGTDTAYVHLSLSLSRSPTHYSIPRSHQPCSCLSSLCTVSCDMVHQSICDKLQQQVEDHADGAHVVANDPSWIVLGVLIIAAGTLVLLAMLFIGVFASNAKLEYETL